MFKQLQILLILTLISGINTGVGFAQRTSDGLPRVVLTVPSNDSIHVTIDTFCASWHICVHDSVGLASATLIDDPNGDIYGQPGKVYQNVHFDYLSDPNQSGEVIFTGTDTAVCFDVLVSNPFDSAYVPLYIVNRNGFHSMVELFYKSLHIRRSTLPELPLRADSLIFPVSKMGEQRCSIVVYINSHASGTKDFKVVSANMAKHDGAFTITSIIPQLPTLLKAGDTLKVGVCYHAVMAGISGDSLLIQSDCFSSGMFVSGFGASPSISATDIDFHSVGIDSSDWEWLDINNTGNLPYNLSNSWILSDTINFSMENGSANELPEIISPSGSIRLKIYFHPKSVGLHSARIDWTTDIDTAYTMTGKKYSLLHGIGTPAIVNGINSAEIPLQSFSIRPNPSSGNVVVCFFTNPVEGNQTLAIFDVLGREVYKKDLLAGFSRIEIPIQNLSEGVYNAKITSQFGSAIQSFVRVK